MPMMMSAPEWRGLTYLAGSTEESLQAVAGAMNVDPSECDLILDHLVYRGFVERLRGRLRLTESGEAMLHGS